MAWLDLEEGILEDFASRVDHTAEWRWWGRRREKGAEAAERDRDAVARGDERVIRRRHKASSGYWARLTKDIRRYGLFLFLRRVGRRLHRAHAQQFLFAPKDVFKEAPSRRKQAAILRRVAK